MIDITNLSKEELIKLREQVNGRIASLTLQEKKKEDPERYSYRNMDLYFSREAYKAFALLRSEYKKYIKVDFDGQFWEFGDNGEFAIIRLWAPKRIRDEILEKYQTHRIYSTYTPKSKCLYKGFVVDRRR